MKFSLLILCLALAIPQLSLAGAERLEKDCTPVNLLSALGPQREQGDIGWCYANTAADLMTYKFRSELRGQSASAAYIALSFNRFFMKPANFDGGFSSLALMIAKHDGICPSFREDLLLKSGAKISLKNKLKGLIRLKERFDQTNGASLEEDLAKDYTPYKSAMTEIPREDLIEILRGSNKKNFPILFADYFCAKDKVFPREQATVINVNKYFNLGKTEPLLRAIHQQLDRNNIVGVSYFADFFEKDDAPNTEASRHVTPIVARQWNKAKNRCELLIRNSYGERCTGYRAASLQEPGVCVKGNIWVSEKVLLKSIFGVTYLL